MRYNDGGHDRSVIYRASLTEMVVPYGDPAPTEFRKNAFDVGEYGMGMCANSLELGCEIAEQTSPSGLKIHACDRSNSAARYDCATASVAAARRKKLSHARQRAHWRTGDQLHGDCRHLRHQGG